MTFHKPYWCPVSGEMECCPEHSGWDVCCDAPQRHIKPTEAEERLYTRSAALHLTRALNTKKISGVMQCGCSFDGNRSVIGESCTAEIRAEWARVLSRETLSDAVEAVRSKRRTRRRAIILRKRTARDE